MISLGSRAARSIGVVLITSCLGCASLWASGEERSATPSSHKSPVPLRDYDSETSEERWVRHAFFELAAEHASSAQDYLDDAKDAEDTWSRNTALEAARREYSAAVTVWEECLAVLRPLTEIRMARFLLAEALYSVVQTTVDQGRSPNAEVVAKALNAAFAVRDAHGSPEHLEASAALVVDLLRALREDALRLGRETGGVKGLVQRSTPRLVRTVHGPRVARDPLPQIVDAVRAAEQAYLDRVPSLVDPRRRIDSYRFAIAETYFLYGHHDEARWRYKEVLSYDWGRWRACRAAERLRAIEVLAKAPGEVGIAAEASRCGVSRDDDATPESLFRARLLAGSSFDRANKSSNPRERARAWRKAARLFRELLQRFPDTDESVEYAMNGALAYRRLGRNDLAAEVYQFFLRNYGAEKALECLPTEGVRTLCADTYRRRYEQRLRYLRDAMVALAQTYVESGRYSSAADQYDNLSRDGRLDEEVRRQPALEAMTLHLALQDRPKALAAREQLLRLRPTPDQRAQADYLLTRPLFNEWDQRGRDEGANRLARHRATTALQEFVDRHQSAPPTPYLVTAFHQLAVASKAGGDARYLEWHKKVLSAYRALHGQPSSNSASASAATTELALLAAEAEYTLIDSQILKDPVLAVPALATLYQSKRIRVEGYLTALDQLVSHVDPRWQAACRARQGSLFALLRDSRPPAQELDRVTRSEVYYDVLAVHLARTRDVHHPAVDDALRRLASLTVLLGNAAMRNHATRVAGFVYRDDQFLYSVPGLRAEPHLHEWLAPSPTFVSHN